MKQIKLEISSSFIVNVKHPMLNGFESILEWKLYDGISGRFDPIRILTTATPYKFTPYKLVLR
jgi:hypothetical protein